LLLPAGYADGGPEIPPAIGLGSGFIRSPPGPHLIRIAWITLIKIEAQGASCRLDATRWQKMARELRARLRLLRPLFKILRGHNGLVAIETADETDYQREQRQGGGR